MGSVEDWKSPRKRESSYIVWFYSRRITESGKIDLLSTTWHLLNWLWRSAARFAAFNLVFTDYIADACMSGRGPVRCTDSAIAVPWQKVLFWAVADAMLSKGYSLFETPFIFLFEGLSTVCTPNWSRALRKTSCVTVFDMFARDRVGELAPWLPEVRNSLRHWACYKSLTRTYFVLSKESVCENWFIFV